MLEKIKQSFDLIRVSLGFFTRIPVAKKLTYDEEIFSKSLWLAPLSGIFLGVVNILLYLLVSKLFSMYIVFILLLLAYIALTGALHLDGLGDFFDGVLSFKKDEELVEVMRDSKTGTGGVAAIVFYLLLTLTFLAEGAQGCHTLFILFLWPFIGRVVLILIPIFFSYPQNIKGGIAKGFMTGEKNLAAILLSLGVLVIFSFLMLGIKGILLMFLVLLISLFISYLISQKLKGLTGDMLGAIVEISQLVFLTACYLTLHII